jgi:hypothetical protein
MLRVIPVGLELWLHLQWVMKGCRLSWSVLVQDIIRSMPEMQACVSFLSLDCWRGATWVAAVHCD